MGLIITVFFSFLLFALIHIAVFHFNNVKRKFKAIMIVLFCASLINLFLGFYLFDKNYNVFTVFLIQIFIYWFCWFFYAHFIIVINRSISVRILTELALFPKGLSLDEIKEKYSLKDKMEDEIKDMLFLKRMKINEEGLMSNTEKGRKHAEIFLFIKKFLNLPKR